MKLNDILLYYSKYGDLKSVMNSIKYGASIDARNEWRATPLYLACQYGHLDIVKYLVYYGADIHAQTESGRTPLDVAHLTEQPAIIDYLLSIGAGTFKNDEEKIESPVDSLSPQTAWFKRSPFLLIKNALQPSRFIILRRIHARIKHLFSSV
jgi:ankyrin repeat protein